jgi:hypothetical protein
MDEPQVLRFEPAAGRPEQLMLVLHGVGEANRIDRLRTHIPHRTWAAALGAVPAVR